MLKYVLAGMLFACSALAQAPGRVTPTGGNVAVPGAAGITIPAVNTPLTQVYSIRYQIQGSGFACVSWTASVITISANTAAATCGGSGAFLVTAGSVDSRVYPAPIPNTALYGIAAAGAALTISWEIE